ncbi:FecR domain-containing protein [Pseudomonas sp. KNUC1026]|uniref:FecR domain-containing protein n=1 Tax=Pseudomonas sp. KNUC1026 TaxID=2893890 RepID=UPI003FA76E4C
MLNPAPSDDARRVARAAARWLVRVEAGELSERDLASLQRWRQACETHERAWHNAQALKGRFANLPPALAMATLDRPRQSRRQLLKGVLGLAVAAPAGWLALRELPVAAWRADLSTGTGERRTLTLADGSELQLNTGTAVNLDQARRRVKLIRGEIALRLASAQPFLIDTAHGVCSLRGGEINVRQDEQACQFSVYSGAADLTPMRYSALALRGGQRVRVSDRGVEPISQFDPRQLGWRDGVLVAIDQPLGDVLRDLDRYRPGVLRWAPQLETLRVTGSFRLADPDQVLTVLAATLPLEVQWRTRYWATLVPRQKAV